MNKNCPNCGAPYDSLLNKCPYCGTSYFDLTAINFTTNEAIYLKIKTPIGIITQKCIPHLDSINFTSNTQDIYAGGKNGSVKVSSFVVSNGVETNIRFEAINDIINNELIKIELDKK